MATKTTRQLYVNLPVRDLEKAKEFFTRLGFEFNPQFTNDQGAAMVINGDASVMLLERSFFATFTSRPLTDAAQSTEVICAISASSRAEVDAIVKEALAAGGSRALEPQDHGFMYSASFYDLDGHHWETVYMDPTMLQ